MDTGEPQQGRNAAAESNGERSPNDPPAISLPKGGGAIRGIGEKFSANPVTGTGSMSVPIATSAGRSGFGPQLSLSYDSGSGNGPFGFGWNLSLPSITRKTDKGLPQYLDATHSDEFILSGAEDLVPVLTDGNRLFEDSTTVPDYTIHRYQPRIEGLFARIERWTRQDDGDVHWRSISRDNILTVYGLDEKSRIADPEDSHRIFSWLICETRDDKGNAILYDYKREDGAGVISAQAHERNRGTPDDPRRTANRYLKRIRYGNETTLLNEVAQRPRFLSADQILNTHWMFEISFDYGEHQIEAPMPDDTGQWHFRDDAFSTYRPGFEVRTTRLCQRALVFHHFKGEEDVGFNCLVRSTDFTYSHEHEHEHEHDPGNAKNPIYTFLHRVTQSGYKRKASGYLKRDLPPAEFEYTQPIVQDTVEEVDSSSLENLPSGVHGAAYQWTDLHGEGIPGILTEQADTWFYKRNESPVGNGSVEFGPLERVATKPNMALSSGARVMDLAGDGQPDVVLLDGPTPGFYEHDSDEGWQTFRPFTSRPNRNVNDPNVRFVDLDGDGHADIFITEDDAFVWHASLAEQGFGPARRVAQALDEEKGPRLVFADGTQSIYLADLCGDNLTDLVRIRNGQVCYWPNRGYGRFGAKISMDNAPNFDNPDQFDHKRVRLADIDGSGTIDIIYLHRDGVRLYFNQSGNSWSEPQILSVSPRVDDLVSIVPTDLLGNGTACLVWSSPLPGDTKRPMRYVNLMGGQKPHLLVKTSNNLGMETEVTYSPSTKFYLADKRSAHPWVTKLPFPVHVVEKVTVTDKSRKTAFSSTYSYHHGYYDGVEREFRGFGRVEQVDVENYGTFAPGNSASPYITDDHTLYQPPVKTISWFHTGAFLDRHRVLSHFENEYFTPEGFTEKTLPAPNLEAEDLTADEWREALRTCKGVMLRQEVYELNVDALEDGQHQPVKLFNTAYHNCHIQRLQAREQNRHAVFLVTESEAITYNYELGLLPDSPPPDPRIAHTLNLKIDEYGNTLQSAAVVYRRIGRYEDDSPAAENIRLINAVQQKTHIAYTESHFTNDINAPSNPDNYRLRAPCAVHTYELTGINPEDAEDLSTTDPLDNFYFTLNELNRFRLNLEYQPSGDAVASIDYHEKPNLTTPQKRLVQQTRVLYFNDVQSESEFLTEPFPFGEQGHLGLPYETYTLALTDELLNAVLTDKLTPEIQSDLDDDSKSGYLSNSELAARFTRTAAGTSIDTTGQYWIRSGIAGFSGNAAAHFFLPERYTDAFDQTTTLNYDPRDLYIKSSTDPVGNTVSVKKFDFRVLAPLELKDINDNFTEVIFDVLGLPTATAIKGKGDEADNLTGFTDELLSPDTETRINFFIEPRAATETIADYQQRQQNEANRLLGNATSRNLYYFGEIEETLPDGITVIHWGEHPASACTIVREKHVAQLAAGETSPLQLSFEYSDGGGNVLVSKVQAEPQQDQALLSWIANGKTILNNKGKPVKQYEPYFSVREIGPDEFEPDHRFEEPREVGVTPIIYYDAAGRVVRTESPDDSYSRVEFSPWHFTSYDQNDTVLELANGWHLRMRTGAAAQQRAARIAAKHAETPATTHLDSLGREVISVAFNRIPDYSAAFSSVPLLDRPWTDEKYVTFTKLDAEGKPLWIRDDRDNLVMRYTVPASTLSNPTVDYHPAYDIAGNLLFQHSMDAGDRWMINDATGQPFYAWDENERVIANGDLVAEERTYHTSYDESRRPLENKLKINDAPWHVIEKIVYGETVPNPTTCNHRGQVYQHFDASGLLTNVCFDFKGNLLEQTRQLTNRDDAATNDGIVDWAINPGTGLPMQSLEEETFTQQTQYDALNRMSRLYNWYRSVERVAVYVPQYNPRGVLEAETLTVGAQITADGFTGEQKTPVSSITYDAKGQRQSITHGNGTTTRYYYDPTTFRLLQQRVTKRGFNPDFPSAIGEPKDTRILQNLFYTYDSVGNITEISDDAFEPAFFRNQVVEAQSQYIYDSLYRLIEATGRENYHAVGATQQFESGPLDLVIPPSGDNVLRNYTQNYRYDAVGNIHVMSHSADLGSWKRNYQYAEDSNRLIQTSSGSQPPAVPTAPNTINYHYDTHGSMLNLANVADEARLRSDYRDMLYGFNLQGGGWAYYQYDSGKQRTRKLITHLGGMRREERVYLGGSEVYRRWQGDALVEEIETHHLFVDDERVLMVEDVIETNSASLDVGKLYRYQYSNHLGSVWLEINEDANVITYEEYHPYGTAAYMANNTSIKAVKKRFRYTGMERDEETGLSYHTARYFAPWLGRWGSADPIYLEGGVNLYGYVDGGIANSVDRKGTQTMAMDPGGGGDPTLPSHYESLEEYVAALPDEPFEQLFEEWRSYHGRIYAVLEERVKRSAREGVEVIRLSSADIDIITEQMLYQGRKHRELGVGFIAAMRSHADTFLREEVSNSSGEEVELSSLSFEYDGETFLGGQINYLATGAYLTAYRGDSVQMRFRFAQDLLGSSLGVAGAFVTSGPGEMLFDEVPNERLMDNLTAGWNLGQALQQWGTQMIEGSLPNLFSNHNISDIPNNRAWAEEGMKRAYALSRFIERGGE